MAASNANPSLLTPYTGAIAQSAQRWGVDPAILGAIILHESAGHPGVVNASSGASGLGQIMPATAAGYGFSLGKLRGTSPADAAYQIDAAAQVLSGFVKAHPGNTTAALEGYGGPGSNLYGQLFSGGFVDAARNALGKLGNIAGTAANLANPFKTIPAAGSAVGSAAGGVGDALSGVTDALAWFTDPLNWLRILIGITGLALVIGGLLHASGADSRIAEAGQAAGEAAAMAA